MDRIPDPSERNQAALRATELRVKSKSLSWTSQRDGFDEVPHRSCGWDEDQRVQIGISPRRIPRVTASVRVEAPSLSRIELMWNLTVCSQIPRRARDFFVDESLR
jgi:hypothetical protein